MAPARRRSSARRGSAAADGKGAGESAAPPKERLREQEEEEEEEEEEEDEEPRSPGWRAMQAVGGAEMAPGTWIEEVGDWVLSLPTRSTCGVKRGAAPRERSAMPAVLLSMVVLAIGATAASSALGLFPQLNLGVVDERIDSRLADQLASVRGDIASSANALRAEMDSLAPDAASAIEAVQAQLDELERSAAAKLDAFSAELSRSLAAHDEAVAKRSSKVLSEAAVRELMAAELNKFEADRTGLPDYALLNGGAAVVAHSQLASETPGGPRGELVGSWLASMAQAFRFDARPHPLASQWLLSPGAQVPGQCLPFNGSSGWVDVKLRTAIVPTAVTIEHIPRSIAYDVRSAPKAFTVTFWAEGGNGTTASEAGEFDLQPSLQTFTLKQQQQEALATHVRLNVTSNHGHEEVRRGAHAHSCAGAHACARASMHARARSEALTRHVPRARPQYTCVYRLRVHGRAVGVH